MRKKSSSCERTNKTLRNLRTSEQFVNVNNDSQVPESRGKWEKKWEEKAKGRRKRTSVRLPIRRKAEKKNEGNQ